MAAEPKSLIRRANVLIVDDRPANQLAVAAVLERDHDVVLAASGEEAIRLLKIRHDIDVILMDVQMPGMDGFEAAAAIKRMPECTDIPIIFVTAVYKEDPHVKRGYEAGGIDYFGKPFDPDILRMKIAIYSSYRMKSDLLRQRERHIRESEELIRVGRKLSQVLESLPVGVMIADVEGRICQITEEVSRILRSVEADDNDAYDKILGWWDANGKILKTEQGPLSRALRRGERSHSEAIRIQCLDGSVKTIVASASPLRSVGGDIVGAVVLLQDITESKKIEEALEERVTKLVALG
ncbi:MAG TPA: response regulator, partial [Burkholderiales bacterium]|nr:response regulator [Burkholderiales bacterium]